LASGQDVRELLNAWTMSAKSRNSEEDLDQLFESCGDTPDPF
jgi:hypothetical protein